MARPCPPGPPGGHGRVSAAGGRSGQGEFQNEPVLLGVGTGTVPAAVRAPGADGLWLGHAWVDGRRNTGDLDLLAGRLRASRIRDVFVHVGPLANDGTLSPARHLRARWLITGLHERVQAWLGDLIGPGHLRLADPITRARVLRAAAGLLAGGFDGIHYDLEPVRSGDLSYLALLAATHRLTRARHAILSVACDQVEPLPSLHTLQQWLYPRAHWWSMGYLHAVAARADQVALMTYGTGVPTAIAYSGYVRLQTRLALAAVPVRVSLLIGLPAYHTSELGHTGGKPWPPPSAGSGWRSAPARRTGRSGSRYTWTSLPRPRTGPPARPAGCRLTRPRLPPPRRRRSTASRCESAGPRRRRQRPAPAGPARRAGGCAPGGRG